jgi:hypothetical protein
VAYVRTVKTASGATAVQIVYSMRRGSRSLERVRSAHTEAELEALKAAANQRLAQGRGRFSVRLHRRTVMIRPRCCDDRSKPP